MKHRSEACGLHTCRETGDCLFPGLCVSDLSPDMGSPGRMQGLDECLWRNEGEANGWKPPERRSRWRRLPVIRHVAALALSWRVRTYAGEWASAGIGIGGPSPYDLWCVEGAFHGYW